MTDTIEVRSERLPSRAGRGEHPGEIVYARYTYKRTRPKGRRASATKRSYVVRPPDIAAFVAARIDGLDLPPHIQTRHPAPGDRIEDQWYHIYVGRPCWVVIELDPNVNWQFEPGQPGITIERGHEDDNCDLEHVMSDGTLAGPVAPATGVCRLIYFRVQRRDDVQHQHFHCNIIHGRKRLDDPDQIDPDIPNDGGRFPRK
jgi:hypothetical protein